MAAAGGPATVGVTVAAGCAWTATTTADWITITSGAAGSGNGTVALTVAANTGAERTGAVTIAGQIFTVRQAAAPPPACTYTLSASEQAVAAVGGPVTVGVTTAAGCAWTATTTADWITITSGAAGSGSGTVALTIAANTGLERTGTVTIAGQIFTVRQAAAPPPPCTYTLSASEQAVAAAGGPVTVGVTTAAGCAWTATTTADWITITSGAAGSGSGTVALTIAANTGLDRSGTVTIAGQVFTVNQAAAPPPPCAYDLTARDQAAPAAGGVFTVGVTTANGCAWTAVSQADWITVTAGAAGSGNGTVSLTVAANTGPQRVGTVLIAGLTFTVTQAAACTYVVTPTEQAVPGLGGNFSVAVTTQPGCAWTATANAEWITITSEASGTGDQTVTYRVSPGTILLARQGTLTVAGQTVTISQAGLIGGGLMEAAERQRPDRSTRLLALGAAAPTSPPSRRTSRSAARSPSSPFRTTCPTAN